MTDIPSNFALSGKVAIVTGATKGMGRAIVERFAQDGARVVVSSRSLDDCTRVCAELNQRYGNGQVVAVPARCVIEERADLQALVDLAVSTWGKVTTLVCCAAAMPWFGPSRETPEAAVDFQFLSVFKSKFWISNMAIPHMIDSGGGSIVYIGSGSVNESTSERSVYTCMRVAEVQLAKNIAAEFGTANIRANVILPGLIDTEGAAPLFASPALVAEAAAAVPMHRTGLPEEIANAVAFLASDVSSFTTGLCLPVDGGRAIHARARKLTDAYAKPGQAQADTGDNRA